MSVMPRLLALTLLALLPWLPAGAQEATAEERLDLAEVRALREQVEGDATLEDDVRARALALYDEAISALQTAALDEERAEDLERERAGVSRLVDSLRRRLEEPPVEPTLALPEETTAAEADGLLARERARLNANRAALKNLDQLAEERSASRSEVSRRLGSLDQEIDTLNDELRASGQRELHPAERDALRKSVLARRQRARQEVGTLRARLSLLDAQATLLPWRRDQAQRRVDRSEKLVSLLRAETRRLSHLESEALLQRVRKQCAEASLLSETLAAVAVETEGYAETLWGPQGIVIESERVTRGLVNARKHLSDLERTVQLLRRKFDAYGHRGSVARWWPDVPDDFPEPGQIERHLRRVEQLLPEVQHESIRLEQVRSDASRFGLEVLADLEAEASGEKLAELRHEARELLETRRELLDRLIQAGGRYSNQLVEFEALASYFTAEVERVEAFLYEHLLFVRSVPKPLIPRPADLGRALTWELSPSSWWGVLRALGEAAGTRPGAALLLAVAFVLLLGGRPWIRRRMEARASQVAEPETDSFGATIAALVHTLLLAAPLPLAFGLAGYVLRGVEASVFLHAAGVSFGYMASVTVLLELTRHFLAPHGLAEAHFGWPERLVLRLRRAFLWREVVFLALLFWSLHLVAAGMRLDSPDEPQLYNNTLGRTIFVVALTFLGVSLLALFRPKKGADPPPEGSRLIRWHKLYVYTYPLVVLATLLPVALAVFGFYLTGFLLAYQMLRTLRLLLVVGLLGGLMMRWRVASLHRVQAQAGEDLPTKAAAQVWPAAQAQVRGLSRFVVLLVLGVGLFGIWSEASPVLQIMTRIQIWPHIAMLEAPDGDALRPVGTEVVGEGGPVAPEAGGEGGPERAPETPAVPVPGVAASSGGSEAVVDSVLTLWGLFQAMLAGLITLVLVKNIPGLFEMTVRARTRLDPGAQVAFSTLVRYAIMILGFSIAFGYLGISWSKIQWLAAALTFGLGFGLQEIVANFVSGLILLTERPVRVGDAVTIGTLQGRVSRIQIRATTITLWDRSEMVVPNKDFITQQLINWTLTDSKRRIEIPVRLAYGTDLDLARETLLACARENPDVLGDPAPGVLVLEFGTDAIRMELRYFVDFGEGLKSRDAIHVAIDRAFREKGISMALPKLEVSLPPGAAGGTGPGPDASSGSGGERSA
jgi:potassium efflux system protein